MKFEFGGFNWKKFGALTQVQFMNEMKAPGFAHILNGDPDRVSKLKEAHKLMKARYKVHTVTKGDKPG